jgi:hypothetical protein
VQRFSNQETENIVVNVVVNKEFLRQHGYERNLNNDIPYRQSIKIVSSFDLRTVNDLKNRQHWHLKLNSSFQPRFGGLVGLDLPRRG